MRNSVLPAMALLMLCAACQSSIGEQTSGLRLENMDLSVRPGESFFRYANQGWQRLNPLPESYSIYRTMDKLAQENSNRLREIITGLDTAQVTSSAGAFRVARLYAAAMDSVRLNLEGWKPLEEDFQRLQAMATPSDLPRVLSWLHSVGVEAFFSAHVGPDEGNSLVNTLNIGQGGLSMASRDYYLDDDDRSRTLRGAFRAHVEKMYLLSGSDAAVARRGADLVLDVETRLARAFRSMEQLRDPLANYHSMTASELTAEYPGFGWNAYFRALGLEQVDGLVLGQPDALSGTLSVIASLSVAQLRLYLRWKVVDAAAAFLSDEIVAEDFDFNSRIVRGVETDQPRWRRSVDVVNSCLGEAVGQLYVARYFPAQAKVRMSHLVEGLRLALRQRLMGADWMEEQTKRKALEKLDAFTVKIGYPDQWKDYSTLIVDSGSYWEDIKLCAQWSSRDRILRYGKPVDRAEWLMTPQTVNAYYNPTTNEICFPAGILQPPFFDMEADDAFNYGAIGVVISHEMTHGFDDQGRLYDQDGNLREWWSAADAERFKARTQVLRDFFSNIEVAPGVKANGEMTLGENIADHGGLQIAYHAFAASLKDHPLPDRDGFTPAQRFFLAYAGVWAGNIRPQEVLNRTKTDVHSLFRWRVDGALPHIDAWYEAFGITPEDPLYLPKEKRASIW